MFCSKNKYWFYVVLTFIVFAFDQISKQYILYKVGIGNVSPFLPGILRFTVIENTGGAFSILKDYPVFFKAIGVINVLVFSYLAWCPVVILNRFMQTGCALILGGTLGNLTDRFLHNAVVDFFDLEFIRFAVFNVADVFIDIGVILILVGWYLSNKKP